MKRTYNYLIGHRQIPRVYKWLWECFCQRKYMFFFWLLLKDSLSIRDILRRKNMHLDSYDYVLCLLATEETVEHLFFGCQFAKDCWTLIVITFKGDRNLSSAIEQLRAQSHPNFLLVAILMSRAICTARNDYIFKNMQPSTSAVKALFEKELRISFL